MIEMIPVDKPLCKDCKFRRRSWLSLSEELFSTCRAPQQYSISLVSGRRTYNPRVMHCDLVRSNPNRCGPNGKWFVQKEKYKIQILCFVIILLLMFFGMLHAEMVNYIMENK